MSSSLEYKIEEFALRQLSGSPGIPTSLQIAHHDNSPSAENERVILTATAGEKELAGPQCYPVSLLVELRTTSRDAAYVESLWSAIWLAIKPENISYGLPYATDQLDPLIFISEVGGDTRKDSNNTRTRSRTMTFKALEK